MEPSNEPPLTPEEHFALLSALHSDALALEKAREEYVASLDQGNDRTRRLKLLLLQQKLGRLQESQGATKEMQALLTDQKNLLAEVRSAPDLHSLSARARLLRASVEPEERSALLQEITRTFPKSETSAGSVTSTTCPNGHLLREFTTPAASYSCDSCNTRFPQGAVLYSCRECNFDVCPSCFSGPGSSGSARPNTSAISMLSQAVLNIGPSNGDSLRQLSENAVGFLAHVAATSIFNPQHVSQEEHVLGAVCVEIFNVVKLSGRVALRKLLLLLSRQGARYALSCAYDHGEAFLRLVLADLASGRSDEDRGQNVVEARIDAYSFRDVYTLEQVRMLGHLDPAIKSSDWYPAAILARSLPAVDEMENGGAYSDVTPLADRMAFLERLSALVQEFKTSRKCTSLEFLVLHYRIKFDRERRKPLLPFSASLPNGGQSEMNLALCKEYLNVEYRGLDSTVPHEVRGRFNQTNGHSVHNLIQDALCNILAGYLPLPTSVEDVELIRAELFDLFAWKVATPADFAPYLNSDLIKQVYREATSTDPFESSYEQAVRFCQFNARFFSTNTPVELFCDFSGVKGSVSVKVFHVDAKQLYRKTKRDINTAIPLDGLMPHEEFTLAPKLQGIRGREVIRLLADRPCAGCFVVEVIANGMAARAVIRKGYVHCAERVESVGHVFYPFDPESLPRVPLNPSLHRVELWVDGKVYVPEPLKEGSTEMRVIVPFLDPGAAQNATVAVLTCEDASGVRNSIFTFIRRASSLSFRCGFFVDREALLSGNRQAKMVLRPTLWLAQSPAPLGLLEDVQVTIESCNSEGTEAQETFQVDRSELQRGEVEKQFKVIPNITTLRASVSAKLTRTKDSVNCEDRFTLDNLNAQMNTVCSKGVFVMPRADGTSVLLVLGRSGEPMQDTPVIVSMFIEATQRPIVWRTRTDAHGAVNLGSLAGVKRVQCQAGQDPQLSTVYTVPRDTLLSGAPGRRLRALENELVQVVCPVLPHQLPVHRQRFALLETGNCGIRDCFSHLSHSPQQGPFVTVSGLARGEYVLVISDLEGSQSYTITIGGAGASSQQQQHSPNALRLPGANGRVYVAETQDGTYPVTVASVNASRGGSVKVLLAGGSTKGRRVHAVARTFFRREPMNMSLANGLQRVNLQGGTSGVAPSPPKTMYVPQRRLGDEILYCTEREKLPKIAGTALDPPSQLVHLKDQGTTTTNVFEAQKGTAIKPEFAEMPKSQDIRALDAAPGYGAMSFGSAAAPPQAMMMRRTMKEEAYAPPPRPPHPLAPAATSVVNQVIDLDYSLDFLAVPSTTLCNLRPDAQTGLVEFAVDPRARWVEILATDEDGTSCLVNAVFPEPEEQGPLDLTHRSKVALDAHVVEMQQVHLVAPGTKFEVGSLATAKVGVLDTFGAFVDLVRALRPNLASTLDSLSFMRNWTSLDSAVKAKLYHQHACHELHLFLKRRDPEFFEAVVRPQLTERPRASRVFMDAFLLDEDLAPYSTSLEDTQMLTIFERALLAVAIKDSNPNMAQRLTCALEDVCANDEDMLSSLRATTFQTAMLKGAADAEAAFQAGAAEYSGEDFGADDEVRQEVMLKTMSSRPRMSISAKLMSATMKKASNQSERMEDLLGEAEEDFDGGITEEEAAIIAQINKSATRDRYKEKGPAHAWSERLFLDQHINANDKFQAPFWAAFARFHLNGAPGGCFLSADLCLSSTTTITEGMLMLSVIDAPFTVSPHRYDVRRDAGEMDIYPSSPCLIFHEQVTPVTQQPSAASSSASATILVGQTLLELESGLRRPGSSSRETEEREPIEILVGKAYVARVVVTNVTSVRRRVKLLMQIPNGALPLCGVSMRADLPSKTLSVMLEPFSTVQHFTAIFYFPFPGQFGWFPAHVCSANFNDHDLLAFAAPRMLSVSSSPTVVDETSWDHLCASKAATIDQICAFLEKERSLASIALGKVAWRFLESPNGKSDWQRVMQVIERRGVYSPQVSVFALVHEADSPRGLERAGRAVVTSKFRPLSHHLGPNFKCKLARFDVRESALNSNTQDKLREMSGLIEEVFPIVNARAHPLQSALQNGAASANNRVSTLYQDFITELCYRSEPLAWELRVRYVILLLEANRIATAKRIFRAGTPGSASSSSSAAQRDFLTIYLAFLVENPLADTVAIARECMQRAQAHLEHPNPVWRDRFTRIVNACTQILGGPSALLSTSDPEKSTQSELAARAPTFEADLENGGKDLVITTQNVPEGSEFRINMFKMNVEHLFSSKPFAIALGAKQQDLGQFAFVLPNAQIKSHLEESNSTLRVVLPQQMAAESMLIQVTYQAQQRVLSRFASSLQVTMVEDFGILRVTNLSNAPVVLAYCKVYARKKEGGDRSIVFFKDGYTDIKGEFDYSGLNTMDASAVAEFAVLVSHPALGCLIRKVASPAV